MMQPQEKFFAVRTRYSSHNGMLIMACSNHSRLYTI